MITDNDLNEEFEDAPQQEPFFEAESEVDHQEDNSLLEDFEEVSEEDTPETRDIDDEFEEVEWEIPDYFPEDLIPPEDFDSSDAELEWYRENFYDLIDYHKTDEFGQKASEIYKEQLIEASNEVEGIKDFYNEIKHDPTIALKKYAPDMLEQQGVSSLISSTEAHEYIQQKLAEEFGDDFREVYNKRDAETNPNSVSAKMARRDLEITQELIELNKVNTEKKPQVITPDEIKKRVDEQYTKYFEPSGMSREDFDSFQEEAKTMDFDMRHLYIAKNWKSILQSEKNKAYEEGRKSVGKKIKQSGTKAKRGSGQSGSKKTEPLDSRLKFLLNR